MQWFFRVRWSSDGIWHDLGVYHTQAAARAQLTRYMRKARKSLSVGSIMEVHSKDYVTIRKPSGLISREGKVEYIP